MIELSAYSGYSLSNAIVLPLTLLNDLKIVFDKWLTPSYIGDWFFFQFFDFFITW